MVVLARASVKTTVAGENAFLTTLLTIACMERQVNGPLTPSWDTGWRKLKVAYQNVSIHLFVLTKKYNIQAIKLTILILKL